MDDPPSHCLAGNSLLLGLPGTGKPDHCGESRARRCTWCPRRTAPRRTWGCRRRRPTTGCAGTCAGAARKSWTGWCRAAGHGALDGPADVKFLLLGDFRQLPAVLDSWAGRPISAPLEHSQLIRDLAGGHRHELTENRSDPGIFNFVKWLRVGEGVPHAGAGQGEAEGALPLQARVAGHHAGHQPQQAHGRERSGEPRPKAPRAGSHPHGVLRSGNTWVYCNTKQPRA